MNNRQAGRRRGRGGQQRPQGNGGGNRDNGNRIDSRARGNAAQLLEKYKNMARDAQMSGDRVNTEYYLQFADHYFRVLSDSRSRFEEQRPPRNDGANSFDQDDGDFEDDEQQRFAEPTRGEQQRFEQPRAAQQPPREDRGERRDRNDRGEGGDRNGNRYDRQPRYATGNDNGEGEVDRERSGGQPALTPHDPLTAMASTERGADEEAAPRRRGRPPRPVSDFAEPDTHDADRLPPALGLAPIEGMPGVEGEPVAAPRPRRRGPRPTDGAAA